jgi:hypothetical protein
MYRHLIAVGLLALAGPGAWGGEAEAVATLGTLGGKLRRDPKVPGKPVVAVDLHESKVTDEGLAHLKGLTNLLELGLSGTQVSDKGLAHLKGLSNLRWLDLDKTKVTAAGMAELKEALPTVRIDRRAWP